MKSLLSCRDNTVLDLNTLKAIDVFCLDFSSSTDSPKYSFEDPLKSTPRSSFLDRK